MIGIMLGDGFLNGKTKTWDFCDNVFRSGPKLAMAVSIDCNGKHMEFHAQLQVTCPETVDCAIELDKEYCFAENESSFIEKITKTSIVYRVHMYDKAVRMIL